MTGEKAFNKFEDFRKGLDQWRDSLPDNFYASDPNLKASMLHWLGSEKLAAHEDNLRRTGQDSATVLNDWAIETNRDENLPALRRFDGNGNRTEQVIFHPAYHEMGRSIYSSEIMSLYETPGLDVLQMALFYLFMQNGEAGHNCPLACTAGAIKLLKKAGSDEVKKRYLPRLLDPDYDTHYHASQFLTELQGGSDVGSNETVAVRGDDGTWRLYGEKWFCSVADAQLMVITARPEGAPSGTKGLSAFISPRHLENGKINNFKIKRLKYKIGTRSMASGEIDLNGMVAYQVGEQGQGFKYVVDIVLNTSRLYNGFAAAGCTRRAYAEASSFAKHREAFGAPIHQFPLIKKSLAFLRTQAASQLASSMLVAMLAGKIADGSATENQGSAFRFLVNGNKYWTSINCTRAVREGIEVLGGNGTIEEFSVLPRLYRDAIVLESWEGTHNVLCQQILRDMTRYQVHEHALSYAEKMIVDHANGKLEIFGDDLKEALDKSKVKAGKLLAMKPDSAQLHIRPWLDKVMAAVQGCCLLAEADAEIKSGLNTGKTAVLEYHILTEVKKLETFGNEKLASVEECLAF